MRKKCFVLWKSDDLCPDYFQSAQAEDNDVYSEIFCRKNVVYLFFFDGNSSLFLMVNV